MTLHDRISACTSPGPFYEDEISTVALSRELPVRLIAYYLPQYHPIPLNDKAWGRGFTEWTNVAKATPRFPGHYQPQLPGDLGFYDLRSIETIKQQASMAARVGIYGFCIHHYWFGGTTVLDSPLKSILSESDLPIRFCLNWANENWTRRWDGLNNEILIAQRHSPEDDIAFARSLEPAFSDPRYIRINGRPLLLIYRPSKLPDARATVSRWRSHFRAANLGDPYLVMCESSDAEDPRQFGMDAAAGFPPHVSGFKNPRRKRWTRLCGFCGAVHSYDDMVSSASRLQRDYTYFPGVCPSWDNSARRGNSAQVFADSTPKKYGKWLASACNRARKNSSDDERIVFINAWNEWGEGAHLEPDRHFGYAYLNETARVVETLASGLHSTSKS